MNIKISHKLLILCMIFGIAMTIIGYIGVNNLNSIGHAFNYLHKDPLLALRAGEKMSSYHAYLSSKLTNYIRSQESVSKNEIQTLLTKIDAELANYKDAYNTAKAADEPCAPNMEKWITKYSIFNNQNAFVNKILTTKTTDSNNKNEILQEINEFQNQAFLLFSELIAIEEKEVEEKKNSVNQIISNANNATILAIAISLILIALLSFLIVRSISIPINNLKKTSIEIGKGNFDTSIDVKIEDELGLLAIAFNRMAKQLKESQQNLLKATIKAENANQAKSQFLEIMSHELRTPLNAILGFSQLMEMQVTPNSSERQEWSGYILDAGNHLLDIINQALSLSHIESKIQNINTQSLCVANISRECITRILTTMVNINQITIDNTITDTTLMVKADEQCFRQVLINLITNAVKFNREHGRVIVSCFIKSDNKLRIEIKDTGLGISKENLSLMFTPFERLDQKQGTISGIGVGLHISKQLIEAMNGSIGVESEPASGSIFWFELPLA